MLGDCKCCEALKEHNRYLQGCLDRTLNLIAPKHEEEIDPKLLGKPETEREEIKYGEG